jgi:hypothetical protein
VRNDSNEFVSKPLPKGILDGNLLKELEGLHHSADWYGKSSRFAVLDCPFRDFVIR